ncbi:MAG: YsnF/AvaK domain-containing protein [Opitutus sp.]
MDTNKKTNQANRDPITGEPGSHPIGTAAGATALGAEGAGAAAGAAAGPIGVGVGAAAGAVIGGLAGHAASEQFNPTAASDLGRYIDYKAVDQNNDKIGTVDAVWEDHTGQPSYLAIRTGWLGLGKAHVIPASRAEVHEESRKIRLPYAAELVKSAPTFDSADDITLDSERQIREYFGDTTPARTDYNEQYVDRPTERTTAAATTDEDTNLRLKAEELKIGKREVEYGGVRLRKIIRTETVNQPVELQREEIVVERVPVDGEVSAAGTESFADQESISRFAVKRLWWRSRFARRKRCTLANAANPSAETFRRPFAGKTS